MIHRGFISAVIVSGMVEEKGKQAEAKKEARKPWTLREFGGKPLWDWMQLLIVPLALATLGLVFSAQQDARQQRIENQRAEADRKIQKQNAQDEALQTYLDQMSALILQSDLLGSEEGDPTYTLAQARTSTVILRLDAERNQSVTRFLTDARLAGTSVGESSVGILRKIDLSDADLDGASLSGADLSSADLSDTDLSDADLDGADLSGADLDGADLNGADLKNAELDGASMKKADLRYADLQKGNLSEAYLYLANISEANISEADLSSANVTRAKASNAQLLRADLSEADLGQADLSSAGLYDADLSEADLYGADLSEADLGQADLREADLSHADLSEAIFWKNDLKNAELDGANLNGARNITEKELEQQAKYLQDATMPNGQKYEDWLKSREGEGG